MHSTLTSTRLVFCLLSNSLRAASASTKTGLAELKVREDYQHSRSSTSYRAIQASANRSTTWVKAWSMVAGEARFLLPPARVTKRGASVMSWQTSAWAMHRMSTSPRHRCPNSLHLPTITSSLSILKPRWMCLKSCKVQTHKCSWCRVCCLSNSRVKKSDPTISRVKSQVQSRRLTVLYPALTNALSCVPRLPRSVKVKIVSAVWMACSIYTSKTCRRVSVRPQGDEFSYIQ